MHLESFCSFLYCRRKFFATDPAISDIFSDGFGALFYPFSWHFFFCVCLLLLLLPLYRLRVLLRLVFCFFIQSIYICVCVCVCVCVSSRIRVWFCVWVWSFVLGAAAVSGKCYLTASVTLHNCSHFLDCATVAVAVAVAALCCAA